eukprot:2903862-Heterocapsa_arctica.AAC.1
MAQPLRPVVPDAPATAGAGAPPAPVAVAAASAGQALLAAQLGAHRPLADEKCRLLLVSRNASGTRTRFHRDYTDTFKH